MTPCGGGPCWPAGPRKRSGDRKSAPWSLSVEGTSGPQRPVTLTCHRLERGSPAREQGCSGNPLTGPLTRGVRGLDSTERTLADKAAPLFAPRSRGRGQSNGPKPAARRQARGCWRPDDREVVRRRPRPGGNTAPGAIERWTSAGYPTAPTRVSRGDVSTGARDVKRRL